jgi:hypothetical protein
MARQANYCEGACRQRAYRTRNAAVLDFNPLPRRYFEAIKKAKRRGHLSDGEADDLLAAGILDPM